MKAITIFTPTYNVAETLADTVRSVRDQHQRREMEVEYFVLDGGSTDSTVEVAESLGLRMIARRPGSTLTEALDLGMKHAAGEVATMVPAGDRLVPGSLDALADVPSGTELVIGAVRWIGPSGEDLGTLRPWPSWLGARAHAALGWNHLPPMCTFLSPAAYVRLGGYDMDFEIGADYELATRALAGGLRTVRIPRVLAEYDRDGTNLSVRDPEKREQETAVVQQRFAPRNRLVRGAMRAGVSSWVHAANPTWALHNRRGTGRRIAVPAQ